MGPLTLTGWQRRRLERQLRAAADARLCRRTLAVLEFARGRSIAGVAGALGVSRHSVYNWVTAYAAEHDPEALHEGSHTGRPSLWTEEFRERLRTLLGQSPQDLGYAATDWTVPLLQEHLERCTGQRFSDDTVRRELQRQRYVWKRPRYVLEPDPELEKKRRIRRRVRQLRPRSVLLAEDETDLLLFPPLRAGWSPRGGPKEVLLSGRNARRVVFGAMNLRTGSRLLLARERQQAADYQAFLRLVHDRYRGWHVALLQDEDPSHTAKGSVALASAFGIEVIPLPKRAPKLNPMDTLWGQAKDVVSANRQYATIEDQVERFIRHLESLSPREALETAGVLSRSHWLKSVL